MRTIPTLATSTLPDRAVFARPWRDGWLVATERGLVLVLDRALSRRGQVARGPAVVDATLAPDDVLISADPRALTAVEIASGRVRWHHAGAYLACRARGGRLWVAEHLGATIAISVRDRATGAPLRALTVAASADDVLSLTDHPDPDRIVAARAGADERAAFLLTDAADGLTATALGPDDHHAPVFTPAGDAYLSAGADRLVYRAWPSDDELDLLAWSDDDDDGAPDDRAGRDLQYLPGGYATWSSAHGRLYLLDLAALAVIDELVIADHPLRTVAELRPKRPKDTTPATDFEYATAGPDGLILTVHGHTHLAVTALAAWSPDAERPG
ncbi:MAG: hypothetical protein IPL61_05660 [Myxococcales bacterium]|nr:hypothetical protein [Myxococcales bacterium]